MRRPSFQFYPADWRNNANLRRCSWEARGAWMEVIGLMHDSDSYGLLFWPLKEIAQALGAPAKLLQELVAKGVLKGADSGWIEAFIYTPRSGRKDGDPVVLVPSQEGPVWYSSRMVKDEYLRTIRGEHTRFGEDAALKRAPKGGLDEPSDDGSTSSSSSTLSPSLRSGERDRADKPRLSRRTKSESTLQAYLDVCKAAGQKPLPPEHPIRAWCTDAGISEEMVQVAWCVFRDDYLTGKNKEKRQKDWPAHFANSVRRRWYQLWYTGDHGVAWTSTGLHEKSVLEARHASKEGAGAAT